jgi:hypothetical protein
MASLGSPHETGTCRLMAHSRPLVQPLGCRLSKPRRTSVSKVRRAAFDPERSSATRFGNEVDIDQHLMMCIVVPSLARSVDVQNRGEARTVA